MTPDLAGADQDAYAKKRIALWVANRNGVAEDIESVLLAFEKYLDECSTARLKA